MGGSSSRRVNVVSLDGKIRKAATYKKKDGFDAVKEQLADKVYGSEGRNYSAAFIRLKARNAHGDFDIDDIDSIPQDSAGVVVVALVKAAGAIKRGLTPKYKLPQPDGGLKAAEMKGEEEPEVKRVAALPKGQRPDKLFSIVVLGASATGKTSLIQRYSVGRYSPTFISTMGVSCEFVNLQVGDVTIKIRITDTAGQDRFRAIAESHLPSAKGVIILFDVTDRASFEETQSLVQSVRKYNPQLLKSGCTLIVGNKVDLTDRCVSSREASEYAADLKLPYFETSARDSIGIDPPFQYLSTRLLNLYPKELAQFRSSGKLATAGAGGGGSEGKFRCSIM